MQFKNLEDKCLYYRSLTDYKLLPNGYTIVMLDGRSFSKKIKKLPSIISVRVDPRRLYTSKFSKLFVKLF